MPKRKFKTLEESDMFSEIHGLPEKKCFIDSTLLLKYNKKKIKCRKETLVMVYFRSCFMNNVFKSLEVEIVFSQGTFSSFAFILLSQTH
jgi:hypothetical protein